MQFTVEEENLICMYHKSDRRRTAANIRPALPDMDEDMAALPGFTQLHPLQPIETAQGALEALHTLGSELGEVFGMDAVTFQPAAGAHGEFTGVLLIKAYHTDRGDFNRTKIIVPDSAHGTNPATAAMCGFQVINIPSGVRNTFAR